VALGKFEEALAAYQDSLAICKTLVAKDPSNTQWQDELGSLGYYFVLARGFAKALEIDDDALSLAPGKIWIYGNRAHALMFLDRVDEARTLYLQYRGRNNVVGEKSWETVVLEDFDALRKAGLVHPLMDEIEKQFIARAKPPTDAPSPASMVSGGNPAQ
jgi:tetratricopeptide (TPR) repeat protein